MRYASSMLLQILSQAWELYAVRRIYAEMKFPVLRNRDQYAVSRFVSELCPLTIKHDFFLLSSVNLVRFQLLEFDLKLIHLGDNSIRNITLDRIDKLSKKLW